MADVTNLFKAIIKGIKSRSKGSGKDAVKDEQHSILTKSKNRSQFETASREVVTSISKLKEFLLHHRKNYMNAGSHLVGDNSEMTDADREKIDTEAENIIRKCQENLSTLKKNAETDKVHPQVKEHREVVLTLIMAFLKVICKIYSEQRAVRFKRVVDKKRISRIQPERRAAASRQSLKYNVITRSHDQSSNAESASTATALNDSGSHKASVNRLPSQDGMPVTDSDDEVSPEEAQMFEEENKAIFEEMNSLSEEVSKIQGKVVEIASLQEIFTEKVLVQSNIKSQNLDTHEENSATVAEEDIVRIANTAVVTTENIKGGNEEIREAMKKNAGFRVWILFFILVLTFSLLFLDWYSG